MSWDKRLSRPPRARHRGVRDDDWRKTWDSWTPFLPSKKCTEYLSGCCSIDSTRHHHPQRHRHELWQLAWCNSSHVLAVKCHLHLHLPLSRGSRGGTIDDFTTSFLLAKDMHERHAHCDSGPNGRPRSSEPETVDSMKMLRIQTPHGWRASADGVSQSRDQSSIRQL